MGDGENGDGVDTMDAMRTLAASPVAQNDGGGLGAEAPVVSIEGALNHSSVMAKNGFTNPWLNTRDSLAVISREKEARGTTKTIDTTNNGGQTLIPSGNGPLTFDKVVPF